MDLEAKFQQAVIGRLRETFPGCVIIKNDPTYMQGVPDLLVLHGQRWAMLEVKSSRKARNRPNQEYYVNELNDLSYAAFIFPENEDEVFHALQHALSP